MAQDSKLKSECNFGKSICEIQLTLYVKLNDKRLFMRKKEKIIIADLVFTLYNTESVKIVRNMRILSTIWHHNNFEVILFGTLVYCLKSAPYVCVFLCLFGVLLNPNFIGRIYFIFCSMMHLVPR